MSITAAGTTRSATGIWSTLYGMEAAGRAHGFVSSGPGLSDRLTIPSILIPRLRGGKL
jgi:hypothetical protein